MTRKSPLVFEQQIVRLQEIARQLEGGELGLEKSLELYKEGVGLAGECRKQLDNARHLVQIYSEEGLKGFGGEASDSAEPDDRG